MLEMGYSHINSLYLLCVGVTTPLSYACTLVSLQCKC